MAGLLVELAEVAMTAIDAILTHDPEADPGIFQAREALDRYKVDHSDESEPENGFKRD